MVLNLLPLIQSTQTIISWLEKVKIDGDVATPHQNTYVRIRLFIPPTGDDCNVIGRYVSPVPVNRVLTALVALISTAAIADQIATPYRVQSIQAQNTPPCFCVADCSFLKVKFAIWLHLFSFLFCACGTPIRSILTRNVFISKRHRTTEVIDLSRYTVAPIYVSEPHVERVETRRLNNRNSQQVAFGTRALVRWRQGVSG